MSEHDIAVVGVWFNTGDAGVAVTCERCGVEILAGDDFGDRLTVAQINDAVAAHLSDTERAMVWHLVANVADDTTACCRRPVVDLPWRDSLTEDAERCTCPASDTERAGDAE